MKLVDFTYSKTERPNEFESHLRMQETEQRPPLVAEEWSTEDCAVVEKLERVRESFLGTANGRWIEENYTLKNQKNACPQMVHICFCRRLVALC